METKKSKSISENDAKLIDLLNEVLRLEYTLIIHYPRLSNAIKDKEISNKVMLLSTASVSHANTISTAIVSLGGEPQWSFEAFPDDTILNLFQGQLEKEKAVLLLHRECIRLASNQTLREQFSELAKDEEWHIQVAKDIIDYVISSGITA